MQYPLGLKAVICIIVLFSWHIKSADIANFQKPSTPPKYFAIDVDKTFYVDDQSVFKKNIDAFKLLKDKNIIPFFCTGKDIKSIKKLLSTDFETTTGYNGYPGVYNNGAVVYDADGNQIKIEKLSVDILNKFKDYAATNNINDRTVYYTEDKLYRLEELSPESSGYLQKFNMDEIEQITYDELKQKNVVTTLTYNHQLDDFKSNNDVHYIKFRQPGGNVLLPKGVNKKTGLEALLNHFKSNGNECAYIGDNNNDHEAMEFCYVSFAVGNADVDTKQKAKWVLDIKHDEGAFEKAVKLLID